MPAIPIRPLITQHPEYPQRNRVLGIGRQFFTVIPAATPALAFGFTANRWLEMRPVLVPTQTGKIGSPFPPGQTD